jgi:hypothetical protein
LLSPKLRNGFDIRAEITAIRFLEKYADSIYINYGVYKHYQQRYAMARNSVTVLEDVSEAYGDSLLHFQWCRYNLERKVEYGYRFMWSKNGKLRPLRGGARIPAWATLQALLAKAVAAGWGDRDENSPS